MGHSRAVSKIANDYPSQRSSKRKRLASNSENAETSTVYSAVLGQGIGERKAPLYHCNYCNKYISGKIRIKCVICPDFDLCVECFSVGVEIYPHKCNHPYRVIVSQLFASIKDNLAFPLICVDWNADEESLLLEGIGMYGFGNWAEVAEHVGTKSKPQCIDHYNAIYMNSSCFPLPDLSHVMGKSKDELLAMAKGLSEVKTEVPSVWEHQPKGESPERAKCDETRKDQYPESTTHPNAVDVVGMVPGSETIGHNKSHVKDVTKLEVSIESQVDRSIGEKKPRMSEDEGPMTELSGYNFKRQEFEIEYDNDAEQLLADMEFKETDTDAEKELKVRVLRIYSKRLDERKRRKDFILERNMLYTDTFEKNLSFEPRSSSSAKFALMKLSKKALRNSAASKFMSIVSNDLLVEIFLRFPNGRSVIQCCTTVSKRWYSLTLNPYTRTRFLHYHLRRQSLDSSYYPLYTTTFLFNYVPANSGPHYQLSSSSMPHPRLNHYDLTPFMLKNLEDLFIRATSGCFLLLNRGFNQYYICNSLTGHCLALPEAPSHNFEMGSYAYALICDVDEDEDQYRYSYRVVLLYNCQFYPNKYVGETAIFESETGLWTERNFSMPYQRDPPCCLGSNGSYTNLNNDVNHELAIPSNGVLHWLDGTEGYWCLVVFDPLRFNVCHYPLPACKQFGSVCPEYEKCKVRLGVVQGRVRLSLMMQQKQEETCHNGRFVSLKVWELDSEDFSWVLVHDLVLEDVSCCGEAMFFVLAFDPCDGNILFLVRGEKICSEKIYCYEIEQDKYKEICEFPSTEGPADLKVDVNWGFGVLTLVHPLWPTTSWKLKH